MLLRHGPVRFVIADVGLPLEWIEPSASCGFWKREGARISVDADRIEVAGDWFYLAARWAAARLEEPVVVLTRIH